MVPYACAARCLVAKKGVSLCVQEELVLCSEFKDCLK